MPIGYKGRRWQAILTVSASGPEYSPAFEEGGRYLRRRMAADLRYTTADVDFLESRFRDGDYDSGKLETHLRLRNPKLAEVTSALNSIAGWLGSHNQDPDWDGGGILFCFAGHGREGDGALVLEDNVLTATDFADTLASIANSVSPPGRLRVSTVLDSCHSAAFTTTLLHECFRQYSDLLIPFHAYASCMDDESAWEESSLGHGIFTYCFSIRHHEPFGLGAMAIQPDNSFGPSLSIVGGVDGCSLLTAGAQNPVIYWNGTGRMEVGNQDLYLFENNHLLPLNELRARLRIMRDSFASAIRLVRPNVRISEVSDAELQASLKKELEFLVNPMPIRQTEPPHNPK